MTTADNFFGGGAKSMNYGKTHDTTWLNRWRGGRVTHIGMVTQQTHIQTGEPLFKRDGSPKLQLPIVLVCDGSGQNPHTNERTDPSDDGRRTVYVKGTLHFALGKALQEHGLQLPEIGGEVYMKWIGMKNVGEFDGRDWQVVYIKAPNGAAASFMNEGAHPHTGTPAQDAPATQHVPQQAPVPAFSGAPAQPSAQTPPAAPMPSAPAADPWGAAPAPQQAHQAAAPPAAQNDPWA